MERYSRQENGERATSACGAPTSVFKSHQDHENEGYMEERSFELEISCWCGVAVAIPLAEHWLDWDAWSRKSTTPRLEKICGEQRRTIRLGSSVGTLGKPSLFVEVDWFKRVVFFVAFESWWLESDRAGGNKKWPDERKIYPLHPPPQDRDNISNHAHSFPPSSKISLLIDYFARGQEMWCSLPNSNINFVISSRHICKGYYELHNVSLCRRLLFS